MGTNITIQVLCGVMADTSLGDPYARYAAVTRLMLETFSINCLDASFNSNLKAMTNTSWDGPAASGGEYGHVLLGNGIFPCINKAILACSYLSNF